MLQIFNVWTRRHRSALKGRLAPTKPVLARVLFRRFFVSRASYSYEYRVYRNRPAKPYTLTRLKFRRPTFLIAGVRRGNERDEIRESTIAIAISICDIDSDRASDSDHDFTDNGFEN
jgi:hypothetical protein